MNSGKDNEGSVVIDRTVGKSTEFRFAYQGSLINVILRNPSGDKVDVRKEEGVNAFVFKDAGLTKVKSVHRRKIKIGYTLI